jgi:hypothetical protein
MSATFNWAQTNGAPAGTTTLLGASGNLVNFKNIDGAGTSNYATNPIPAGNNSFELWLRGNFSGVFNSVSNIQFWMSTGFSPSTGLTVMANTQQVTYAQPTSATSSIATSAVSTSAPGTQNVSVGGSLTSSITSSGYTDYIVLQLQTTTLAPAGDTSLATFSCSYIES